MSNSEKQMPQELLAAAYGEKRAKQIVRKIERFEAKNPNKHFSFIFAEDGSFKAVEKSKNKESEEDV